MEASSGTILYSPDPSSEGFWSMFGSRIGLVAKIMDFLNDPRPSRVARSSQFGYISRKYPTAELNSNEDRNSNRQQLLPASQRIRMRVHQLLEEVLVKRKAKSPSHRLPKIHGLLTNPKSSRRNY
ncbi:hypothetical protein Avbf_18316 [Armadillidium vulgare]|nr:hypothetical protein Avbf_18316 [Armadillidium vulgare]